MAYRIAQWLYKRAFLPLTDAVIGLLPRYICTVFLLSLARRLKAKNLRFDLPIALGDGAHYYVGLSVPEGDRSVIPYIAHKQGWEIFEPRLVFGSMPDGQVYELIDAGANMGLFTLQLLALLERSNRLEQIQGVHMLEPDPKLVTVLKANVTNFDSVPFNVVPKAVGTVDGMADFYLDEGNNSNNSLRTEAIEISTGKARKIQVEVLSASALPSALGIGKESRIIYKSDLQGTDVDVLLNLSDDFLSRIDVLIFELWPRAFRDSVLDTNRLLSVLSQFGHVVSVGRAGQCTPLDRERIERILRTSSTYDFVNVFCSRSMPTASAACI